MPAIKPQDEPSDLKARSTVIKEQPHLTISEPQTTSAGPSSSHGASSNSQADSAPNDSATEPGLAGASSSDWNLAQSEGNKATPADPRQQDQGQSASAAAAAEQAVQADAGEEPQPKLNKKQRRAQRREQAAHNGAAPAVVSDASLSSSPAASPKAADIDTAAAAAGTQSTTVQEPQPQQAQHHASAQHAPQSNAAVSAPASSHVWGANTQQAPSDHVDNTLFPPLSQGLQLPPAPRPPPALPRKRRGPSVAEPSLSEIFGETTAVAVAALPEATALAQSPPTVIQPDSHVGFSAWSGKRQMSSAQLHANSTDAAASPRQHDGRNAQLRSQSSSTAARIVAEEAAAAAGVLSFLDDMSDEVLEWLPRRTTGQRLRGTADQLPATTCVDLVASPSEQVATATPEQGPATIPEQSHSGPFQQPASDPPEQLPAAASEPLPTDPSEQSPADTPEQLASSSSDQAGPSRRGGDMSVELQRVLAVKPKPSRAKAKKLPQPSADLILQRALMEKPRPRPRPRRVANLPSSEEAANGN